MSTPLPPQYAPFQTQPPAPKKRFNWKLALTVFAAILIGGVVGSVTKPAPPPVVQVQEKEVEKKVTPASCLSALEQAEAYMASSNRAVKIFVEVLDAVQDFDYARINSLNPKIKDETAIIEELSPKYLRSSAACRVDQ